jgi:DUF4097 and DUF4098 domain-containing protein YvlB
MVRASNGWRNVLLGLAVVGLMALVSPGCIIVVNKGSDGSEHTYTAKRAATAPVVAGKPLRVETKNGSVRVEKQQVSEVQVNAELHSSSQGRLDEAKLVAERQGDGTLLVQLVWPNGHANNEGASVAVVVPDASGVKVETSNGWVDIVGLGGDVDIHSTNGSIHVQNHDGRVSASTSNGGIELEQIRGDVDAHTSNGWVKVGDVVGRVEAHTSNGAVHLRLAAGNEPAGSFNVTTSNSNVTVEVPANYSGVLDMDTSHGRVSYSGLTNVTNSSGEEHSAHVVVGSGSGQHSSISTSNGSISVQTR